MSHSERVRATGLNCEYEHTVSVKSDGANVARAAVLMALAACERGGSVNPEGASILRSTDLRHEEHESREEPALSDEAETARLDPPVAHSPSDVLRLQRTIGNHATGVVLRSRMLQRLGTPLNKPLPSGAPVPAGAGPDRGSPPCWAGPTRTAWRDGVLDACAAVAPRELAFGSGAGTLRRRPSRAGAGAARRSTRRRHRRDVCARARLLDADGVIRPPANRPLCGPTARRSGAAPPGRPRRGPRRWRGRAIPRGRAGPPGAWRARAG
jgi:hypothetical protein